MYTDQPSPHGPTSKEIKLHEPASPVTAFTVRQMNEHYAIPTGAGPRVQAHVQ